MKKFTSSCIFSLALSLAVTLAPADTGANLAATTAPAPTAGATGTVRGDRCNVRSRPSTTAEVICQLHKGAVVEIRETKLTNEGGQPREWLRIGLPETAKCYVSAKLVADGVVTSDAVNVRCGPGTNYREVGQLAKGETVSVVATSGAWTQIKPTTHCSGWISADLVEVAVAAPVAEPVLAGPAPEPFAPAPAPLAEPEIKVISTDPDVHVQYVIKRGVIKPVAEPDAPAPYQLLTPEVERRAHRMCFLETKSINLERYLNRPVRVGGMERWQRGDRYPVLTIDRVDIVW